MYDKFFNGLLYFKRDKITQKTHRSAINIVPVQTCYWRSIMPIMKILQLSGIYLIFFDIHIFDIMVKSIMSICRSLIIFK